LPSVKRRPKRQVPRTVEGKKNISDMLQRSSRTFTRKISVRLNVPRIRVWRTLHKAVWILIMSSAFSISNARSWPTVCNAAVGLVLTSTRSVTFCSRTRPSFTQRNCRNQLPTSFSLNLWCGVIVDQLIAPYIFRQRLTGDIYTSFLKHELPALWREVRVRTRCELSYQHEGTSPHFSRAFRQYLYQQFPYRFIRRSGAQNWPPRSSVVNQVDYHAWGYMKPMVYAHKLNPRELVQRILSASRRNSNVALPLKFVSSQVTLVTKNIKTEGA
jgi:hypothetical protein